MKSLFSLLEAAEFLGLTENEMRNEVGYRQSIAPTKKGRTRIFTLEQLNDWKANNGRTSLIGDKDLLDVYEAAEFLGIGVPAVRHMVYTRRKLPVEVVGHSAIFRRKDLQTYLDQKLAAEGTLSESMVAVSVVVPVDVRQAAQTRANSEKLSMYQLLETLWQEWVDGRRMVFPGDMKEYQRLKKERVYSRVPESLNTAVKEKCAKSNMKLSYVTAYLLDRWSRG